MGSLPRTVLLVLVLLLAACAELPSGLPGVEGYDGLVDLGWEAFVQWRHEESMDYFQSAIEVDVTRPEALLGAGLCGAFLGRYRHRVDEYLAAAVQQDIGRSAVFQRLDEVQTQDTMWTVFQCVDPDLPPDSLEGWLSLTADSGIVWVSNRIHSYLEAESLDTGLSYRFRPLHTMPLSCMDLHNVQSAAFLDGDSISEGFIYLTAPLTVIEIGEEDYYSWIMAGQTVGYDYATLGTDASAGQITRDALAGWTLFHESMYDEGDALQATACAGALLTIDPDYAFGEGDSLRESALDVDIVDVAASGAVQAFYREKASFAWFLCRRAGYGLELDPGSPDFMLDLLEVIETMQGAGG